MNFTENAAIENLILANNQFIGPLPDIPAHVTTIGESEGVLFILHNNRFSCGIPNSWWRANLIFIDLSNSGMAGELPDVPPSVVNLVL